MCGIVGYVGQRSVQEILLAGLEKLEYRGYDSAGHLDSGRRRPGVRARGRQPRRTLKAAVGRARRATARVAVLAPPATTGIGHTRWATHGRVTEENAHPHYDPDEPRPRRGQRDRRELHGAQAGAPRRRAPHFTLGDRRRGDRAPDRRRPRRARPRRGDAPHVQPPARPLLVRGGRRRRARRARRRPQGVPADRRPRRRRAVPRLRHPRLPGAHAHRPGARGRRARRPDRRRRRVPDRRRRAVRARDAGDRLGRRRRREGRLRDVHAQGDPRAGRRRRRDDRRPHRPPRRRRPPRARRRAAARRHAASSSSPAAPPTTPA